MDYVVNEQTVAERPTAVIAATTTWAAFASIGRVVPSALPAGRVATTTHRGAYDGIGAAHKAVTNWCDGHGLRRTGTRWEIYGHWTPDVAEQTVEIHYLLG